MSSSKGNWLIQGSNMSKERYDRVPSLFVFLRTPLSSICLWSKFSFKKKKEPLSVVRLPFPHLAINLTYCLDLLQATVNSCAAWVHPSAGLGGHHDHSMRMEQQGITAITHIIPILSVQTHVPLPYLTSLKSTSSRIKLLRILRWQWCGFGI